MLRPAAPRLPHALLRLLRPGRSPQDAFFKQLRAAPDGFSLVAEYFGKVGTGGGPAGRWHHPAATRPAIEGEAADTHLWKRCALPNSGAPCGCRHNSPACADLSVLKLELRLRECTPEPGALQRLPLQDRQRPGCRLWGVPTCFLLGLPNLAAGTAEQHQRDHWLITQSQLL